MASPKQETDPCVGLEKELCGQLQKRLRSNSPPPPHFKRVWLWTFNFLRLGATLPLYQKRRSRQDKVGAINWKKNSKKTTTYFCHLAIFRCVWGGVGGVFWIWFSNGKEDQVQARLELAPCCLLQIFLLATNDALIAGLSRFVQYIAREMLQFPEEGAKLDGWQKLTKKRARFAHNLLFAGG